MDTAGQAGGLDILRESESWSGMICCRTQVVPADPQGGDAAPIDSQEGRGLSGRPVVIGEVLFDVFPDGSLVLGGAPFNVAWHLHAFGLRPLVVTRVGDDPLGEQVLEAMDAWGMDRLGVQVDPEVPTGRVRVDLDRGVPSFTILADQAYDRLDGEAALDAAGGQELALVYHGTLIARGESGRATVRSLRERSRLPAFIDVNLRDPWWSDAGVTSLLRGARWVKLNEDELTRLIGTSDTSGGGLERSAAELASRHDLDQVVVTRGEEGVLVWVEQQVIRGRPPRTVEVIDTVGAGDAFSAVWIAGLIGGWATGQTLTRALEFAGALCAVRGATTVDRQLYENHLEDWQKT